MGANFNLAAASRAAGGFDNDEWWLCCFARLAYPSNFSSFLIVVVCCVCVCSLFLVPFFFFFVFFSTHKHTHSPFYGLEAATADHSKPMGTATKRDDIFAASVADNIQK